jgi:hypothetical protein
MGQGGPGLDSHSEGRKVSCNLGRTQLFDPLARYRLSVGFWPRAFTDHIVGVGPNFLGIPHFVMVPWC